MFWFTDSWSYFCLQIESFSATLSTEFRVNSSINHRLTWNTRFTTVTLFIVLHFLSLALRVEYNGFFLAFGWRTGSVGIAQRLKNVLLTLTNYFLGFLDFLAPFHVFIPDNVTNRIRAESDVTPSVYSFRRSGSAQALPQSFKTKLSQNWPKWKRDFCSFPDLEHGDAPQ